LIWKVERDGAYVARDEETRVVIETCGEMEFDGDEEGMPYFMANVGGREVIAQSS
jgi:hypothetical protein